MEEFAEYLKANQKQLLVQASVCYPETSMAVQEGEQNYSSLVRRGHTA